MFILAIWGTGKIPNEWHESKVVPLYKEGDKIERNK